MIDTAILKKMIQYKINILKQRRFKIIVRNQMYDLPNWSGLEHIDKEIETLKHKLKMIKSGRMI